MRPVALGTTVIGIVESSRSTSWLDRRIRGRNREIVLTSFCNLRRVRVENCRVICRLNYVALARTEIVESESTYSACVVHLLWFVDRFFALGIYGITKKNSVRIAEATSLRFTSNINFRVEAVKVMWNFYRSRSMMFLSTSYRFLKPAPRIRSLSDGTRSFVARYLITFLPISKKHRRLLFVILKFLYSISSDYSILLKLWF